MLTEEENNSNDSPAVFDGTDLNFSAPSSPEITEPSEQEILRDRINVFNENLLREISPFDYENETNEHLDFLELCSGFFVKDFGEAFKLNIFLDGKFQLVECFSKYLFKVARSCNFAIFSCSYGFVVIKYNDLDRSDNSSQQIGLTYSLDSAVALIESEDGLCDPL